MINYKKDNQVIKILMNKMCQMHTTNNVISKKKVDNLGITNIW